MITANDIRNKLLAYLASEITLYGFIEWLAAESWEVETTPHADAGLLDMVEQIKLHIFEFAHGDWTELEMRGLLRPFVEQYTLVPCSVIIRDETSNLVTWAEVRV